MSRKTKTSARISHCALRRLFRGATQLDLPCGKPSLSSRTPDTCRPGNGCVPRRFLLIAFRSALRSPFTSSARTAVPLSAAPCAVPRGCYYSSSTVYMKVTLPPPICQESGLYLPCIMNTVLIPPGDQTPGGFSFLTAAGCSGQSRQPWASR